jgi:hypothetical protein
MLPRRHYAEKATGISAVLNQAKIFDLFRGFNQVNEPWRFSK